MKRYFILICLVVVRIIADAQPVLHLPGQVPSPVQNEAADAYLSPMQENNIIGSWNLELQAFDKNSNGKLDDEERNKGTIGRHFYQFNADGTCLIHTMKLKGSYELKTVDGKKRLFTYIDDEGTKTRKTSGI